MGVIHVGSRTWSARIAKSSFSSLESSSSNCWARVLLRIGKGAIVGLVRVVAEEGSDQTVRHFPTLLPVDQFPKRTETAPGSMKRSNSIPPRSLIH